MEIFGIPIFFTAIFLVSIVIDRMRGVSFSMIWKQISNMLERH